MSVTLLQRAFYARTGILIAIRHCSCNWKSAGRETRRGIEESPRVFRLTKEMILSASDVPQSASRNPQFFFASQIGLEQKAKEFVEKGAEVYAKA